MTPCEVLYTAHDTWIMKPTEYLISFRMEKLLLNCPKNPSRRMSLRHGFRCVPENGVKVEEVLLAVGEQVGAEFIHSASRMNRAVVVFMQRANLVGRLIASGIFVRGVLVPISPLSTPSTRVVVANLPPFITDDPNQERAESFW
ncbi:unnamed protein product [Oncorhynchus mykiss]|uniref:Uncharacterized protein n=1 Tax=Oncorhynchus mykiss TaxID=8022 RepID=A0A060W815_ONCMY|nr:unnamed protein product [Oncorhynchus mykiss]